MDTTMDFQAYLTTFGPWVALALTVFWPFVADKVWPSLVKAREDQLTDRRRREDLLIKLSQDSTQALVSLQKTLEGIDRQLSTQADDLHDVKEDVAIIRSHVGLGQRNRGR